MNVDVVCAWYLTCDRCGGMSGFSLKQPLTMRPPRACPCGAEFSYEWRETIKYFTGDDWEHWSRGRIARVGDTAY